MKLNLHNQDGVNDLIYRVLKLSASAKPRWGSMDATEMLQHCNAANKLLLQGIESTRKSSFRQKALKNAFLYLPIKFPRNIKAPKTLKLIASDKHVKDFEKEKELYIELISQLPAHQFPSYLFHPVFGNLNSKQWGVINWMHMDHHLRQFNV
ncbi:MAG: DUF1569 domain-containing protein [Ginsengibacter sp.]